MPGLRHALYPAAVYERVEGWKRVPRLRQDADETADLFLLRLRRGFRFWQLRPGRHDLSAETPLTRPVGRYWIKDRE